MNPQAALIAIGIWLALVSLLVLVRRFCLRAGFRLGLAHMQQEAVDRGIGQWVTFEGESRFEWKDEG